MITYVYVVNDRVFSTFLSSAQLDNSLDYRQRKPRLKET